MRKTGRLPNVTRINTPVLSEVIGQTQRWKELIVGKNHNLPVQVCDLGDAFNPRLLRKNNRITEIKDAAMEHCDAVPSLFSVED